MAKGSEVGAANVTLSVLLGTSYIHLQQRGHWHGADACTAALAQLRSTQCKQALKSHTQLQQVMLLSDKTHDGRLVQQLHVHVAHVHVQWHVKKWRGSRVVHCLRTQPVRRTPMGANVQNPVHGHVVRTTQPTGEEEDAGTVLVGY